MNNQPQKDSADAWPGAIFAITLFTEDLVTTTQFYRDVFNLPTVFEGDTSAVFQFGSTLINLLTASQVDELIAPAHMAPSNAGNRAVYTLHVDDVDAISAELQRPGVRLLNGPMDRPWGIRTASFQDPAGNLWEIAK